MAVKFRSVLSELVKNILYLLRAPLLFMLMVKMLFTPKELG